MSLALNSFHVFVPERRHAKVASPFIAGVSPRPHDDWRWNEGWVEWTVDGVTLLDASFGLYPEDQINSVLEILELMLAHKQGSVNVPGSIITLSTEPVSRSRAKIIWEVPARRASSRIRSKAERREVTARIPECARVVLDMVRAWTLHVAPPPSRPSSAPEERVLDRRTTESLARLERLEQQCAHLEARGA